MHRLADPTRFGPWAYTIVRRRAADHLRRVSRVRHLAADYAAEPRPAGGPAPDRQLALAQALAALPARDREILTLACLDDLPISAIAALLAIPEGTVKSRLHAARERLKTIWHQEEVSHDQL